jgi:hypothetical protein
MHYCTLKQKFLVIPYSSYLYEIKDFNIKEHSNITQISLVANGSKIAAYIVASLSQVI